MQPLIAVKKPIQFDSDADGSFLGSRRIYGARETTPAGDTGGGWFAMCCANAEGAARAGFAASLVYLFAAGAYATMLNGSLDNASQLAATVDSASRKAGLSIDKIIIQGRVHISEAEVMSALGVTPETSMPSFDAQMAQQRLAAIGWIKAVEIQRVWPSTLVVAISERLPFAIWRDGARTVIIDADGVVLGPVKPDELTGLPRVQGDGAPPVAKGLVEMLAAYPAVKDQVREAERISQRRWDLHLTSGLRAKLPEDGAPAMARLASLLADQTTSRSLWFSSLVAGWRRQQ